MTLPASSVLFTIPLRLALLMIEESDLASRFLTPNASPTLVSVSKGKIDVLPRLLSRFGMAMPDTTAVSCGSIRGLAAGGALANATGITALVGSEKLRMVISLLL